MPTWRTPRRARRRGRRPRRRRRHARPARAARRGRAARGDPARRHGPRGPARPDGADAGQDERLDVRPAGRPGRRRPRHRDRQRHRGRPAARRPTGRWPCCPPTSRPSPRAWGSTSTRCASTSPSARPPGSGCSPRCRGSGRSCWPRCATTPATSPSTPTASSRPCSRSTPATPTALQAALQDQLFRPDPSPAQRAALARLETYLALVEGWVDVVAERATREHLPQAAALGEAVRRRRATGGPAEKAFAGLVGLELRPRRLRDAANLWAALEARHGAAARDAAWGHPDVAPTARRPRRPPRATSSGCGAPSGDDVDAALDQILREGDAGGGTTAGEGGPRRHGRAHGIPRPARRRAVGARRVGGAEPPAGRAARRAARPLLDAPRGRAVEAGAAGAPHRERHRAQRSPSTRCCSPCTRRPGCGCSSAGTSSPRTTSVLAAATREAREECGMRRARP